MHAVFSHLRPFSFFFNFRPLIRYFLFPVAFNHIKPNKPFLLKQLTEEVYNSSFSSFLDFPCSWRVLFFSFAQPEGRSAAIYQKTRSRRLLVQRSDLWPSVESRVKSGLNYWLACKNVWFCMCVGGCVCAHITFSCVFPIYKHSQMICGGWFVVEVAICLWRVFWKWCMSGERCVNNNLWSGCE